MKRTNSMVLAAAAPLLVAACQTAAPVSSSGATMPITTEAEFRQLVVGKPKQQIGRDGQVVHTSDGRITLGAEQVGQWYWQGDAMCISFGSQFDCGVTWVRAGDVYQMTLVPGASSIDYRLL